AKQLRSFGSGGTISAIHQHTQAAQISQNIFCEPLDIAAAQEMLSRKARRRLGRRFRVCARRLQNCEYFLFDSQLARIWQLESIPGENFYAVVGPRIVRRGDDHASIELLRTREIGDSRSGNDPGAPDFNLTRT